MTKAPRIFQASARHLVSGTEPARGSATLDTIDEKWLASIARQGFNWLYLYGVWDSGNAGRAISRAHPSMWAGALSHLSQGSIEDVCGSPFAIREYRVDPKLGDEGSLRRLRDRAQKAGLKLMLDFVVNHTALDHPWVAQRPEWFVQAKGAAADSQPGAFVPLPCQSGEQKDWRVFAHGKDPYFPAWVDTLQLNLLHPDLIRAHTENLLQAARQCDGLRCDMAMLGLGDVFRKTWGVLADPADGSPCADEDFWTTAIDQLRSKVPDCLLCGEIYWSMEGRMLDMGFDLAYDKTAYDLLRHGDGRGLQGYEAAVADRLGHLVRFGENHDESRMAAAFGPGRSLAALPLILGSDGPILVHQGQLVGERIPAGIHLSRQAPESSDFDISKRANLLLEFLVDPGEKQLVRVDAAWPGNPSHECVIVKAWKSTHRKLLLCVNYAGHPSQARVRLPDSWIEPNANAIHLEMQDHIGGLAIAPTLKEIAELGLFVELPPWGTHLFEMGTTAPPATVPKNVSQSQVIA